MNLIPSIALTNLISFVCRLISCDSEYEYPTSNDRDARILSVHESAGDDANFLVHPIDNLEVVTKTGRVRGYVMKNVRGDPIIAFSGIPYAEPPIGDRRFQPPVPKKPWTGTLLANKPGSQCLQLNYGRLRGSEDCLHVTVYTKNVNPPKRLPVLVFVHGGFFMWGSGELYGPSYLLVQDVVLVTFNYRLGPLGFFTTNDNNSPGNNGLRDQAELLNWVQNNIIFFGGDPAKVTIIGSSAGGASVHLQLMSNSPSKAKINSAISLSGTAYNIWALNKMETAKMVSMHLANISGCPTHMKSQDVISCMRRVDPRVIVANQLFTLETGFFLPSIEPDIPGAFLSNSPDQAYTNGNVAKIPWIVTMTSREVNLAVTALQADVLVRLLRAAISTDLASLLTIKHGEVNEDVVRKKIVQFYTGSESVAALTHDAISQIATDRYFTVAIRKAIQMHSQVAPTYASIFNYSSTLNRAGRRGLDPRDFGTFHGDDLIYFLNSTRIHPPIGRYDSHFAITKLLVNLIANFATHGKPLYETEDHKLYKIWDEINPGERLKYLSIDEEVKMIDDPFEKVAKFWNELGILDLTPPFKL